MLDLLIIGGSAAGCSAAIYAARRKLNFKIVTNDLGGEVALSGEVNNWIGIKSIQGFELAKQFADHVKSYDVQIDEGFLVQKITPTKNYHVVEAKNSVGKMQTYEAKAVIIATGIHPRKLNVPGEKELDRKGVTYCTVCDGPLFKNKVTATVGAGNSALESALMMAELAKKVYVLTKYPNTKEGGFGFLKGESILIDKLKEHPNVEILYEAMTTEIKGDKRVTGLTYRDAAGETHELALDAAMIHVGQIPNSDLADVTKNKQKEIMVDEKCHTNVPGLFAAGDVTNVAYKQIGIAVGQGIISALAAIEYINRWQ